VAHPPGDNRAAQASGSGTKEEKEAPGCSFGSCYVMRRKREPSNGGRIGSSAPVAPGGRLVRMIRGPIVALLLVTVAVAGCAPAQAPSTPVAPEPQEPRAPKGRTVASSRSRSPS